MVEFDEALAFFRTFTDRYTWPVQNPSGRPDYESLYERTYTFALHRDAHNNNKDVLYIAL